MIDAMVGLTSRGRRATEQGVNYVKILYRVSRRVERQEFSNCMYHIRHHSPDSEFTAIQIHIDH